MKVGRSVAQRDSNSNELDITDSTDDSISNVLDSMGTRVLMILCWTQDKA